MKLGKLPLIDKYLRAFAPKEREPASRTYRYMSRLIEQEFGQRGTGVCLGFFSPDNDRISANTLLMLSYGLQSELDSRVLIVDARLRSVGEGLTQRLGLSTLPGYAEVLREGFRGRVELIQKTAIKNVDVLPAGQFEHGTLLGTERERLREFLEDAKRNYSYVLVQIGPVLADTRNLLTASLTDPVFLIAQENHTFMKAVDDSRKLLISNGIQDLRVIISYDQA